MHYTKDRAAIQQAWDQGKALIVVTYRGSACIGPHLESVFEDEEFQILRLSKDACETSLKIDEVLKGIEDRIVMVSIDSEIDLPRMPKQGGE